MKPEIEGEYLFRGCMDLEHDYPHAVVKWTPITLSLNPVTKELEGRFKAVSVSGFISHSPEPCPLARLYGEWRQADDTAWMNQPRFSGAGWFWS